MFDKYPNCMILQVLNSVKIFNFLLQILRGSFLKFDQHINYQLPIF